MRKNRSDELLKQWSEVANAQSFAVLRDRCNEVFAKEIVWRLAFGAWRSVNGANGTHVTDVTGSTYPP